MLYCETNEVVLVARRRFPILINIRVASRVHLGCLSEKVALGSG